MTRKGVSPNKGNVQKKTTTQSTRAKRKRAPASGQKDSGTKKAGSTNQADTSTDNQQQPTQGMPVYISQTDLKRHIHESLKPLQRMADQSGQPFLAYLIAMAIEESKHDSEKH